MIKEGLLSLTVFYVSLPLMLGLLGWALYGVNWQVLASNRAAQHVFYGSVLLCLPFWLLSAGILPGLHFHLLGMTALTLVMGWRLALLVGFIVQIILCVLGKLWWAAVPYQFLLAVALPVFSSIGVCWLVARTLPHNPFVYILLAAFVNAGIAQALSVIAQSIAFWGMGVYQWETIWYSFLSYLPMMMFPEGTVNGMFITAMVVFHNRWLSTFDANSYFK